MSWTDQDGTNIEATSSRVSAVVVAGRADREFRQAISIHRRCMPLDPIAARRVKRDGKHSAIFLASLGARYSPRQWVCCDRNGSASAHHWDTLYMISTSCWRCMKAADG